MKLELQIGDCFCYTKVFKINGITADKRDFGYQEDIDPYNAEPYGCGNMQFIPELATQKILDKYNITIDEYNEITEKLREGLSFGSCGWCV